MRPKACSKEVRVSPRWSTDSCIKLSLCRSFSKVKPLANKSPRTGLDKREKSVDQRVRQGGRHKARDGSAKEIPGTNDRWRKAKKQGVM